MSQPTHQINEDALKQEMSAWIERRIQLQRERMQRAGEPIGESTEREEVNLRSLSGDELFSAYQNNFWIGIKMAFQYFDDDGVVKPKYASCEQAIQAFHLLDIRRAVLELGCGLQKIRDLGESAGQIRKLTGEELLMIKAVFLKMRNCGYSHRDLMG